MKIGFILYDNFSNLDFSSLYAPFLTLKRLNLIEDFSWETCAQSGSIKSDQGVRFAPTRVGEPLTGYDLLIVPGSLDISTQFSDATFLEWLRSAESAKYIGAIGNGVLLLAAAGILKGKKAASTITISQNLEDFGAYPQGTKVVEDGSILTVSGSASALELGFSLCEKLINTEAAAQLRSQMGELTTTGPLNTARRSRVVRKTRETEIEVELNIDGSGKHDIQSGLPFLDHMLNQIAVHGLFDLKILAKGDIEIDPHHTMEDIGLALGQAFREALGDRSGIVRMASHYWTMDESLAWAAVDFSGRPYAVIQTDWHDPSVGGLPTSLFAHFLESFALEARCNLHVRVLYGRDDHHQAEAIFKALTRALDAATQIDPRRAGNVPSSKGILF